VDLAGNLASISLSSVLQLLCEDKKTGTLRVRSPGYGECQIVILGGEIVYAARPFQNDRLGERMIRDGRITAKDLDRCLAKAKSRKQALGKCLVEEGLVTEEGLSRYLERQIEDFLFHLFCLSEGFFEYSDKRPNLKWLQVVSMNTARMILSAAARSDEAAGSAPSGQKTRASRQKR